MSKPARETPSIGYLIGIATTAALGGFLFGFDTAVINGAVIALEETFQATAWIIGLSVSLALLGSAAGAFAAGPLADRVGRTRCMVWASVFSPSARSDPACRSRSGISSSGACSAESPCSPRSR